MGKKMFQKLIQLYLVAKIKYQFCLITLRQYIGNSIHFFTLTYIENYNNIGEYIGIVKNVHNFMYVYRIGFYFRKKVGLFNQVEVIKCGIQKTK